MASLPGDRARALVRAGHVGTLSTAMADDGSPYGSVMPYVPDHRGRPLFLSAGIAVHTANMEAAPAAGLLVAEAAGGDPQAEARVSLLGRATAATEAVDEERYFRRYPAHRRYLEVHEFGLWRLDVDRARFIGGFGDIHWLTADDYLAPDGWATEEAGAVAHMNADHADGVATILDALGEEGSGAVVAGLDPDGMDCLLGDRAVRVPFAVRADSVAALRETLVAMVRDS